MGCGASTPAPTERYAVVEQEPSHAATLKKRYSEKIMSTSSADEKQWDVFLSYDPSADELATTVRDRLTKLSYKVPTRRPEVDAQKLGVRASRKMVVFFSPLYFESATCCAEFCEAVEAGVEVLPVCVEGATWHGQPFPQLTDVPEAVDTSEGSVRPRDAATAVFGHTIALDHKAAYLQAFLEKLSNRLGPAAAAAADADDDDTPVAAPGTTAAAGAERTIRFDAFLSHKRSEAQDIVARVHDRLTDLGYRAFIDRNDLIELPSLKLAVRDTATLVVFLTPAYFASAW